MSKSKSLLLEAKQKSGKWAVVGGTVLGSVLASPMVMALTDDQNTEVTTAMAGGATSVGLVVSGLIAMAAVVVGLALVYKLLGK
ncbi:MAG: hypothetical protein COA42_23680 [Alteromonadaceae bacterium]|nr:MAG: hypothetical protein COA42_23680 [Alteromonadaceae bacterium]